MKYLKIISLSLAVITAWTAFAGCGTVSSEVSVTASEGTEKYVEFLTERLGDDMPRSTVIAVGDDTEKYGADLSGFVDEEGYTIRANGGDVVILGKTEASIDRAVRRYVNYGNSDNYTYTYGEDYRVGGITIAGNDISEYSVMLPEESDACHKYAAKNLCDYIGKACGIYPTVSEYSSDRTGKYIRLVRVYPGDEMYGILGDEGFSVKAEESGDLVIFGGYCRGCMYGVFDFLEQYIGWRFLTNPASYGNESKEDLDYLYEAKSIDIPADLEYTETADIAVRHNIFRGAGNGTEDFRAKRKINANISSKGKNSYGLIGFASHGLQKAMKDDAYFDFSYDILKQPCFTDEDLIEVSKEYFTAQTQAKVDAGQVIGKDFKNVDVAQFDTADFCLCDTCVEYYLLDGGNVGPVLYFTNIMSRHLADEFGDEIQVSMLAYWGTSSVPKVTRPESNVNVSFCFFTEVDRGECHNHCISGVDCGDGSVSCKIYGEQLKGWSEIAEILTVWYYPGYWSATAVNVPLITNLRDDFIFLKECGVDGIYVCVSGYYMANEKIIPYLMSNLAWDCDITEEEYDAMIADYYRIVYGDGYELLLEYEKNVDAYAYDHCWSTNVLSGIKDRIEYTAVRNGFLADIELFRRAKAMAGTEAQEKRIEELSLSVYFTGLAVSYETWYENGDEESRTLYTEIWDEFMALATEYEYYMYPDWAYGEGDVTTFAELAEELSAPTDLFEYFEFEEERLH